MRYWSLMLIVKQENFFMRLS